MCSPFCSVFDASLFCHPSALIAQSQFELIVFVYGSFLDDLERVTALKYMPSDDDVLKARLKTVGVAEYKFEMEVSAGRDSGTEWWIVDVGGSRSQRREPFD
jgi:hypothetical protein